MPVRMALLQSMRTGLQRLFADGPLSLLPLGDSTHSSGALPAGRRRRRQQPLKCGDSAREDPQTDSQKPCK